jgi:hypothetical protein
MVQITKLRGNRNRNMTVTFAGEEITIPFHYTPDGLVLYKTLSLDGIDIAALKYMNSTGSFVNTGAIPTQFFITAR